MRIAVGGFQHESHSFAPVPTRWDDFLNPGGWPTPQRGGGLVDNLRGTGVPAAGAIQAAERSGIEIVPLAWAFANPAGPVQAEAFERVCAFILSELSDALARGPLDGIYLDLHGAMVAEEFPDAEGELLRRVRALAGPEIPIACSLDPHCNLTAEMVGRADALAPYRTYPHVDMKQAGARAIRLLVERMKRGRPFARAYRQADFWLPITSQCTLVPPMSEVYAERERIATRHGVSELAFCFGFPYADFPGCGMAVAAFASDQGAADAAADEFLALLNRRERDFAGEILPAERAVAEAIKVNASRPVVIADTQDNPGGGGHGDTTGLLAELVRQNARKAVVGSINDPESAAACHRAGEGATVSLKLGGRSDGSPLEVTARVLRLSNGRFTCTGAMAGGNPADLGPTALIAIGGVRAIVTSRKMQAYDLALFRHIGVEPAQEGIVVVKSSVHFRADFQPLAERVIVAAAPGPVVADPATLPFRHLRPGLRLRPGANEVTPRR
ncbi:M81 family metallopeptidase [Pararoseomonas sp. SCSIO 73927]|uniref:M81 family metallopeptidase n=1 Tax=Pararoseomonas sp. SCSIO 73927 TaxID=3114537 RepID=UPI0030CFBB0B